MTGGQTVVRDRALPVALAAVGAGALGAAVQVANGAIAPAAIAWLTVAVVAVAAAVLVPSGPRAESLLAWLPVPLVLVLLALQFVRLLSATPVDTLYGVTGWEPTMLAGIVVAAIGVAGLLLAAPGYRHLCVAAVVGAHAALGIWLIRLSPTPPIDVYYFQRDSVAALLSGVNPYAITFPDIYGPDSGLYGPGLSVDGQLTFGFPYPPLSVLLSSMGDLVGGDVRFAQLIAMTLTGLLIAYTRPGILSGLAAALYLFTPRSFYVLSQSWTEPFLVLFLAATVFVAVRAPRALPYAFGLFLAVKQYAVLVLPLVLLLVARPWFPQPLVQRARERFGPAALRVVAVVAVVSVPLAVWAPAEFLHSVVTLQFGQPFRRDALSYLAWSAGPSGEPPFGAEVAFLAAAVLLALALWLVPRTPAGFALGVAAVFLAFFAPNKQAFCNYYLFVIGALCVAVGAAEIKADVSSDAEPAR